MGRQGVPTLMKFLESGDPGTQGISIDVLGRLGDIRAVRGLPGPPPIMLDRGSVPNDPAYSYEPNVPLSPVNPVFRRVTQTDLNAIDLRGAIEYREDDPARYSSKSLAKIVYTNSGRTEGFIDLGFWTLITPENPLFSARP
ncbi:MAG: hypothetical protein EBX52_12845 [Proteobacteria bacterium]|nr:hypothetical protein [Pseudomonadota bacterium]